MFSFHKPKIYRSNLGCCICKAKSSSSRFTDSKKYENEFERCFRIQEKRSGEICNACVLLVKRWKKLSPDNRLTKHWHHVVDARAGPGTKLTNIRRITSSSSSSSSSTSAHLATGAANSQSSSSSSSATATATTSAVATAASAASNQRQRHSSAEHSKSDLLPLTSNQSANSGNGNGITNTNNQPSKGRTGSFSSHKARAVDTNVSTFTFGETTRRNYMALESNYFGGSSSSTMSKPQSALNSSAFELVIKRFRQRQQQQQIEANRRQQSRLRRMQKRQQQSATASTAEQVPTTTTKRQLPVQQSESTTKDDSSISMQREEQESFLLTGTSGQQQQQPVPMKRVKRLSESIGSLTVDGFKITNLLDGSVWRKERTCCGLIFRGLNNEVAIFPKLLRPCQQSPKKKPKHQQLATGTTKPSVVPLRDVSPPPRTTKSGSISSCDSNTSGTGSVDCPPLEHFVEVGPSKLQQRRRVLQRKSELRLRAPLTASAGEPRSSTPIKLGEQRQQQQQQKLDSPGVNSSLSEEGSSSGASMSHLMLMEDEEEGIVCEMEIEEDFESSTDGSSESLSSSASDSLAAESRGNQSKKSSNSVIGAAS